MAPPLPLISVTPLISLTCILPAFVPEPNPVSTLIAGHTSQTRALGYDLGSLLPGSSFAILILLWKANEASCIRAVI